MPSSLHAIAFAVTTTRLSTFDLALVAVYLVAITLFGLRFREKKGDKSLKSYFLANNTIPWWAIALSIVSAETSTLTIVSIPGVAFASNFGFLQLVIGYMFGRIVVALLFLPRYFAGQMLTAYQLIDQRFGPTLHKVTAGLFLLTRAAAEGVRVFAVSIVVGIAIGTKDVLSIAIISALTLLYTFEGGMTAVIWTDVVQMFIYIGGTVVAIFTLGSHVTGGWTEIHHVASAAGKFHMLNFAFNLTSTYTFWAGVLGGTFLTMASHGTDQLMVQRMLAARNLRESQLALLSSGVVIFLQFTLFLLIGAGLYVFYTQHPATFSSSDRIFPTFIVREMPIGIAGLLVAAILAAAMSNLSAALNSLSSTTVVDFYMRFRPTADDRERNIISKSSTVLWALVLFAIAVYSVQVGGKGHVVEIGLSIASVAYGCLLGVFLLGTLTRYANEIGASIGMVCGFALNLWLWQGTFPVHFGPLTIPQIAYPWYTLIGAGVTFLIGSIASLISRKQSTSRAISTATIALLFFAVVLNVAKGPRIVEAQTQAQPQPDFTEVSTLINDAVTTHKLPGAVIVIGHNGHIAFEHAYGNRKLANEPGLDGKPSPAEPMTEDTIFDMASLSKVLVTAPAIMQLYEQGKLQFDDPIAKYFPEFLGTISGSSAEGATIYQPGAQPQVQTPSNARAEGPAYSAAQTERAKVTIRMLLTHTSGETEDVDLKDPWGLAAPNKAEGIRRALTTPLKSAPGEVFRYSDINFIILGALVEKLSGQTEDVYAEQHIFTPLGMTETRYLPIAKACGPDLIVVGATITLDAQRPKGAAADFTCRSGSWYPDGVLPRTAPTTHDDEGNAQTNPHFDQLTRGTVHDPTTRRMGGVAGHAGVFSTAADITLFSQALLDKLIRNTGPFPLKQSTLQLMTAPQQPAGVATETILTRDPSKTEPTLLATKGTPVRGFGWDINSAYSRPRGAIFPTVAPRQPSSATPSFGHTGFTGTSIWFDPASDTDVILLANAIHPRGNPPISTLRGNVATAAARAFSLDSTGGQSFATSAKSGVFDKARQSSGQGEVQDGSGWIGTETPQREIETSTPPIKSFISTTPVTLTGIDALEASHFSQLAKYKHLGLLTNQAGIDAHSRRTVDILATDLPRAIPTAKLAALFSPEHGLSANLDTEHVASDTDAATGLHVTSLYGPKDSDKRPTHDQLKDLDAVVIDLQDAGVHFWTYEAVMGYFLEAASHEKNKFHHDLKIIVLDRPSFTGGLAVEGPLSDAGRESYVNYMPLPVRHGMTFGELARYFNTYKLDATGKPLNASLTVIPMQHWTRDEYFADTHLPWVNPSPNLRDPIAAILYPGIGLIEQTNISIGRGTDSPFHIIGAAWLKAADVAAALTARQIPGVTFAATTIPIAEDANKYPFHGQTIEAVRITLTDRNILDSPELGIEILAVLHKLYPTQFQLEKVMALLDNQSTLDALKRGDDPRDIAASWKPALDTFKANRAKVLLY